MMGFDHFVLFKLDDMQFALPISAVERIARSVEITPLPKAPSIVLGVINVQGRVVPVVDIRKRFSLPAKKMQLSDHIVLGKTSRRSIAILVDSVLDIIETAKHDVVGNDQILSEMEYFQGVVKLKDGILLVHDLEKLLSLEEEQSLDKAMEQAEPKTGKGKANRKPQGKKAE